MSARFNDARDWFFDARYGMFVHWGLYALPAWHEQVQWRRHIPRAEYAPLLDRFNPTGFDADAWLDLMDEAGMKYLCFTAKHHDGFCLWDTKHTDFSVLNTPHGKDLLARLAEACHRRGVPLCLYYSVVDWHHPNYPNRDRSHELAAPEPGDEPDWEKYFDFLKAQVCELCTNYGELHGFWWDMNVSGVVDPSVNDMIRELQPKAVINNRGFDDGDFGTPERDWEESADHCAEFEPPVEACQSVGIESWGYKEDEDHYTDRHLIRSLDKVLAKGGNYLLNVGPKADGTIPLVSANLLRRLGKWLDAVGEAFEDTEPASHLIENHDVLLTRRGNTLYVHLFQDPTTSRVLLRPLQARPRKATLLNTGEEIEVSLEPLPTLFQKEGHCLRLRNLPVEKLADSVMVAKLDFEELPVT